MTLTDTAIVLIAILFLILIIKNFRNGSNKKG